MSLGTPVEELIDNVTRACSVLQARAEEWRAIGLEADADLLANIAKRLERDIQAVTSSREEHTPPTGTYVDRIFEGLEHPRANATTVVLKWLRRRFFEAPVLMRTAIPIAELVGEFDLADAMRRWLERVEEGPDMFKPPSSP